MSRQRSHSASQSGPDPDEPAAGLRVVPPGGHLSVRGHTLSDIGPQSQSWIPDVLEALVPDVMRAINETLEASEADIRAMNPYRLGREIVIPAVGAEEIATRQSQLGAASNQYYLHAVGMFVRRLTPAYGEPGEYGVRSHALGTAYRTLTRAGTGRGPWPFTPSVEVLRTGPASLLANSDRVPGVTLNLDGESWLSAEPATVERSFQALDALSTGIDIRLIVSPALAKALRRQHPEWADRLGLTETRNGSITATPEASDEEAAPDTEEAWSKLVECDLCDGHLRLLDSLSATDYRTMPELRRDDDIGLADGTIGRYAPDLEGEGLVDVDREGPRNRVSLSAFGEVVVAEFLSEDCSLIHPQQSGLDDHLTGTPHPDASTVCSPDGKMGGGSPRQVTAEEHLCATGDPDEGAEYVQWLGSAGERLDAWEMHDRQHAAAQCDGVTVTDADIDRFEDGRVTYLSLFDDEFEVVTQWGGPLPTMGRCVAALLDPRALSTALSESTVGHQFEELLETAPEDLIDILLKGSQIGWFSEDELRWEDWFDRWTGLRASLLSRLADAADSDDTAERRRLFEDLQGILASATALYRLAGVDISVHIRVPDTTMLQRDETRYQDFLDFLKHTIPKHTAYGVHSAYRQNLEHREEKLKSRLPVEIDADGTADPTARWAIIGPGATEMQSDIEAALASNNPEVREAIRDGTEEAPAIEIPVVSGNTYRSLKRVVTKRLRRKGYSEAQDTESVREFVRVFEAVLGGNSRRASPMDVAEALTALEKKSRPWETFTIRDVESGLAKLPADRLFPDHKQTVRKMFAAVLSADAPIGRSEVISRAGVSPNSYDRNWHEMAALSLVEKDKDGQWSAWVDPWWADVNDMNRPRTAGDSRVYDSRWNGVLYDIAIEQGTASNRPHSFWGEAGLRARLEVVGLAQWQHLFETYSDPIWSHSREEIRTPAVQIGRRPAGTTSDQSRLLQSGA